MIHEAAILEHLYDGIPIRFAGAFRERQLVKVMVKELDLRVRTVLEAINRGILVPVRQRFVPKPRWVRRTRRYHIALQSPIGLDIIN